MSITCLANLTRKTNGDESLPGRDDASKLMTSLEPFYLHRDKTHDQGECRVPGMQLP